MARVGPVGWGVWLAGLAYCNRNLTDGFIPYAIAEGIGGSWLVRTDADDGREKVWSIDYGSGMHGERMDTEWVIGLLVEAGLWEVTRGGYAVHDYENYQPSKVAVLEERRKATERQTRSRSHRKSRPKSQRDSDVTTPVNTDVSSGAPVPVPVPVPRASIEARASAGEDGKDCFDLYYTLTVRAPSKTVSEWLDRLESDHGATLLAEQMTKAWEADPNIRDFLGRVEAACGSATRKADKAADERGRYSELEYQRDMERQAMAQTPEQRAKAKAVLDGIGSLVKDM